MPLDDDDNEFPMPRANLKRERIQFRKSVLPETQVNKSNKNIKISVSQAPVPIQDNFTSAVNDLNLLFYNFNNFKK